MNNAFDHYSLADWQTLATKSLRDKSLAELAHVSAGGLAIEPLYSQRPLATGHEHTAPMQRWDNRLALIGANALAQNTAALEGLRGGIDSLQITTISPEKPAYVHIEDIPSVLANVQLDIIVVSLFAGSQFINAANQLESLWSNQGIATDKAVASINADPLGTLASTGTLTVELNTLLHDMTTLALTTHKSMPKVRSVCVNSVCYHNAGATIEQELVSAIATGALYLQALLDAGLGEQAATDTIVFQMACDADTLTNIVKLRVLKQLWIHVATQMGVANPQLNLVAQTSARMQSRQSPWVNHLRNVSAATAAAMGGAQSIIVQPHNHIDDQFVDDQIDLSARVARNIPIILGEESAMTFVHDPMAGSYAVETLSANLINSTWQALQQLENDGGLIQALTTGQWQAAIATAQQERISRLKQEQDIQVGVNRYNGVKTTNAPSTTPALINHANSPLSSQEKAVQIKPLVTTRDATAFED